jgi:hypothetical protein
MTKGNPFTMNCIMRFPSAPKSDPAIDLWMNRQTPELSALVRPWFAKMRACGDDVRELMHDGYATACVEDAPFAYVGIFRAHANVGFFHGAELKDPARLLEGSGKRMRHVKLKPAHPVDAAALANLIEAAYTDIRARLRSVDR